MIGFGELELPNHPKVAQHHFFGPQPVGRKFSDMHSLGIMRISRFNFALIFALNIF
jgi:hypothetical protein